jgi:hypothetical protein
MLPKLAFGREFASRVFSWSHVFDLKRRWYVDGRSI